MKDSNKVLEINQLSIQDKKSKKKLLQHLHLSIQAGEMVGLVGESGSGKSITASAVMGLLSKQLEITEGTITFLNHKVHEYSVKQLRPLRGKEMSMVFQDYNGSLTPFMKIGKQIIEIIQIHKDVSKAEAKEMALAALQRVNLPENRIFNSYPFELSGGQKQRVAIAMAMIHKPALLIADEVTTALDVVTGERILELIDELRQESQCAVLYITHHLCEVLNRADRVAVMYGGQIIEEGTANTLEQQAKHPFTELLLKSRPSLNRKKNRLELIPGEPGNIALAGCPFTNRCPKRKDSCLEVSCDMTQLGNQHFVACHLYNERSLCEVPSL